MSKPYINKLKEKMRSLYAYASFDWQETKHIGGLTEGAEALFYATYFESHQKDIIIVKNSEEEALSLIDALNYYETKSLLFPAYNTKPFTSLSPSREIVNTRAYILSSSFNSTPKIIVTSLKAISKRLINPQSFSSNTLIVNRGDQIDIEGLRLYLSSLGYVEVSETEEIGECSFRGGIIDIFSPFYENPIRIELFDDEVESLRFFSCESQRSINQATSFTLFPARECVYTAEVLDEYEDAGGSKEVLSKFDESTYFVGNEYYLSLLYPPKKRGTIFDYFPNALIFFSDYKRLLREYNDIFEEAHISLMGSSLKGLTEIEDSLMKSDEFESVSKSAICLSALPRGIEKEVLFNFSRSTSFKSKMTEFMEYIASLREENYIVQIVTSHKEQASKFAQSLEKLNPVLCLDDEETDASFVISTALINEGFISKEMKTAVIVDREVFGRRKKQHRKIKYPKKSLIESFSDLSEGDYVVHINHGIGRYLGLTRLKAAQTEKDYLMLEYDGGDKLYIPVEQMNFVQKYLSAETSHAPNLDKLGGKAWEKAKAKAKKAAEDMAAELVRIYSMRESVPGFAFGKDTVWQEDFEASFPYQETRDQLRAIEEIKTDMESPTAMDRLVCGDVGFGKTEVALRAAFKAIMSGKQVAFLCPTTVLSQQHFLTAVKRFKDYPIKIELLNRFRNATEQKRILHSLKKGDVDILIGTHKILAKEVEVPNLGLLIIDEEQRFGVKHKESIKKYKTVVDVLTLSATPIPRTLNMSLMQIRDISVIETPPLNRIPVQTFVLEFNDNTMADAIRQEIERGGQVFVVYNRVSTIREFSAMVSNLVPEARVVFAHGQMEGREIEKVMVDFIKHEYDVLVATTIIENGIDIPNSNTILIYRADSLGLSELYQLRGRVGRSSREAYAYFFYPANTEVNETASKRLKAIAEHTDLGSGFKIAMRDLEIRGAGNILGKEQSGYLYSVGYELYSKLLEEAVSRYKGEIKEIVFDTVLDIKHNLFIPDSYIADTKQKIEVYKSILRIESDEDADALKNALDDKYGKVEENTLNLIEVAKLKAFLKKVRVLSVIEGDYNLFVKFNEHSKIDSSKIVRLVSTEGSGVYLDKKDLNQIIIPVKEPTLKWKVDTLKKLISSIKAEKALNAVNIVSDADDKEKENLPIRSKEVRAVRKRVKMKRILRRKK